MRYGGGYLNPHSPEECPDCGGSGYNPETHQISEDYYDFAHTGQRWCDDITQDEVEALVAENRLWDFVRVFTAEGWKPKVWNHPGFWCPQCHAVEKVVPNIDGSGRSANYALLCEKCKVAMEVLPGDDIRLHIPTAAEVNAWQRGPGFGHDGINRGILIEARAKRLGVWGYCETCKGEGVVFESDEHKHRNENWTEQEPPTGPGYQFWETVSEGSPISPVFPSRLALAKWCADNADLHPGQSMTVTEWYRLFLTGDVETGSLMVGMRAANGEPYFGSLAQAPSAYVIS
jgi:hypothetical protein